MDENNEVLQALKEGFTKVEERFARIDERFAKVEERFTKMLDERFAHADKHLTDVAAKLGDDIHRAHLLIEDMRSKMAATEEIGSPLETRVSALEVLVTRLEKKRRN